MKTSIMNNKIFHTNNDWTGLILRITLGLVLFPHGAQKLLGSFGGPGFAGTIHFFTETLALPWVIAFLVIVIEFFGSLCLILGLASRLWSIAILIEFLVIIFMIHLPNGFFMNWQGDKQGEGFEFHILILGISLATIINGSGKFSIDKALYKKATDYR